MAGGISLGSVCWDGPTDHRFKAMLVGYVTPKNNLPQRLFLQAGIGQPVGWFKDLESGFIYTRNLTAVEWIREE